MVKKLSDQSKIIIKKINQAWSSKKALHLEDAKLLGIILLCYKWAFIVNEINSYGVGAYCKALIIFNIATQIR